MEKIDRLGWAAGFSFSSFGVHVGVRTNSPEILPRVMDSLPTGAAVCRPESLDLLYSFRCGGAARRKGTRTFHLLYGEFVQLVRTEDVDQLLRGFRDSVEYLIPQLAPEHIFVHAGAVGWNDQAILLPGRSFAGKSRLVAAMVKAGATYYSDEFAVIGTDGLVHPYPRPLSLRPDNERVGVPTPIDALGGVAGSTPLPVAAVISTSFREGARWQPRTLPPGKGILELLSNTVPARKRPGESLSVLKNATAGARFLKGSRGEADEIAAKILKQLNRPGAVSTS